MSKWTIKITSEVFDGEGTIKTGVVDSDKVEESVARDICKKVSALTYDLLPKYSPKADVDISETEEDLIESAFLQLAHLCEDGWYNTMAISTTRDLGDYLVKTGRWERRDNGHGRRWFYRLKEKKDDS